MLSSIESYRTCDFPRGGGPDPLSPPLYLCMLCMHIVPKHCLCRKKSSKMQSNGMGPGLPKMF